MKEIKISIVRSDGAKIEDDRCRAAIVSYFNKDGKPVIDIDGQKGDILQLVMYILHMIISTMNKEK